MEEQGLEHKPAYFVPFHNPEDDQTYFVYNGLYFEKDRSQQEWSRLPDIFG